MRRDPKARRSSTETFSVAGCMLFLVAVSFYDRDPSPFTWLLIVLFVVLVLWALRQRARGD